MTQLYDYLNQLQSLNKQLTSEINSSTDSIDHEYSQNEINSIPASDNEKQYHNIDQNSISGDKDLSEATGKEDFITNGQFNVYTEGDKIFVDIKYKNKEYKHLPLYTTDTVKNINLWNKIKLAGKFISQNIQYHIQPIITRTNGEIKEGKIGTVLQKGYLTNQQLLDLDPQNSDVLGVYSGDGFVRNASGTVIYKYNNTKSGKLGSIVFLLKQNRGEGTSVTIPVQMWTKPLGELGAHVVTSLLREKFLSNDINATHNGIDIDQLLRLLVHIQPSDTVHDDNTIYSVDNGTVQFRGIQYSLSSNTETQALEKSISDLNLSIDQQLLSPRMKSGKYIDAKGKVTSIQLYKQIFDKMQMSNRVTFNPFEDFGYNDLQFDKNEFEAKDFKGNSVGYTGLAWAMKHGILVTNVDGLSNARVSVNDVVITNKVNETKETEVETLQQSVNNENLWDSLGGELYSKSTERGSITENQARQIIKKLVGNVPVNYFQDFIDTLNQTAGVTGQCVKDCINLSSKMSNTVPYHEAFHRIIELLLPSKVREDIYNKYRKYNGLQDATERQIAERIADDYAQFRVDLNNKLEKNSFLIRPFNRIYQYAKLFTSMGSKKLALIYTLSSLQAFRFAKTNKSKQSRFDSIFSNHLEYTVHDHKHGTSVELKNCINSQQLNDAVHGLSYILLKLKYSNIGEEI